MVFLTSSDLLLKTVLKCFGSKELQKSAFWPAQNEDEPPDFDIFETEGNAIGNDNEEFMMVELNQPPGVCNERFQNDTIPRTEDPTTTPRLSSLENERAYESQLNLAHQSHTNIEDERCFTESKDLTATNVNDVILDEMEFDSNLQCMTKYSESGNNSLLHSVLGEDGCVANLEPDDISWTVSAPFNDDKDAVFGETSNTYYGETTSPAVYEEEGNFDAHQNQVFFDESSSPAFPICEQSSPSVYDEERIFDPSTFHYHDFSNSIGTNIQKCSIKYEEYRICDPLPTNENLQIGSAEHTPASVNDRRPTPQYRCNQCDLVFKSTLGLNIHTSKMHRRHSLLGPYKCSKCNYSSEDKHSLQKHKRKHARATASSGS